MPSIDKLNGGDKSAEASPDDQNDSTKIVFIRQINFANGVTFLIGIIIGTGIFVSPKGVLIHAGSAGLALIVWVVCGLFTAIGGTCYAELATSIGESGGVMSYIRRAFGDMAGFLYMWTNFVGTVLITAVNCFNIKLSIRVNDIGTFMKLAALGIIIMAGVVQLAKGHTHNLKLDTAFEGSATNVGDIALACYSGLWPFLGSNALNFMTEEVKKPERNIPRAIFTSVFVVTIVYVLVNISYFTVLPTEDILQSSAVAVTFADRMLGVMKWCMPIFVALSVFCSMNAGTLGYSRTYVVAGRHGYLPALFGMIHITYRTPIPSLLFRLIVALVMLTIGDVYSLIVYNIFLDSLFNVAVIGSIFYFRWKLPEMRRPFKPPLILPIIYFILTLLLVIFPLLNNSKASLIGVGVALSGVPVYCVCIAWKGKPKAMTNWLHSLTDTLQKLLMCVKEEGKFE